MQIVIDIDEDIYKSVVNNDDYVLEEDVDWILLENAIANGTPLPKHHGRLIDADALNARMEQRINEIGDDRAIWEASGVETALDMFAPTIIEGSDSE